MANITKVPNGPLIKKKGPFKGSTLKSGGTVKKAQGGISKKNSKDTVEVKIGNQTYVTTRPKNQGPKWVNNPMPPSNEKEKFPMPSQRLMDSVANYTTKNFDTAKLMKKKAQGGVTMTKRDSTIADIKEQTRLRQNLTDFRKKVGSKPLTSAQIREKDSLKGLLSDYSTKKRVKATGISAEQLAKNDQKLQEKMAKKADAVDEGSQKCGPNFKSTRCGISKAGAKESKSDWKKKRNGGPVKKAKAGAMIKRADGSMSRRGLWDNLRANKGSGKKPTAAMLKQEKKIKAKTKK